MKKQLMSVLALAVLSLPAYATESEDFVRHGVRSFSAFQCVAAANLAGLKTEESYLTNLGLSEGKAFLEARDAGKATTKDIYRGLPQGFYNVMSGPTHDFILGRVFEVASSWVSAELTKDNPLPETLRVLALTSYRKQNCGLL